MTVKDISSVCRVIMLVFHNGFRIVKMLFELVLKQLLRSFRHIQCQYSQESAG